MSEFDNNNNCEFVHLHVHTEYSLLDGANRIKDLINRAGELGMKDLAITDHGVMYGIIDFYKQAVNAGIKPILGCEVYTARRTRHDKQPGVDADQGHLILLAKNNVGYKNLMKVVSLGFTEGFYYRPRIDFEVLERYSEGLIALSGCLSGDIPRLLLHNNYEKAKELGLRLNNIFGKDNFFLEIQINGIEEQNLVNQSIIKLSRETGIPLIATNDAHYLRRDDAKAHDVLLCIQTGKTVKDENRMRFSSKEIYLKSKEEMSELFKNIPEALENTVRVAQRCNVELEFGKLHLPEFKVDDGTDSFEFLKKLCSEGLIDILAGRGEDSSSIPVEYSERLEYELNMIKQMGYVDYFLIVWDFIKYARDNGIAVGPGRGSAAGSLVSYSLGITNINPLKYKLLFERFLNPERISMPDIDIDFCYERRQEVIDYVVKKYGEDRVAQIITFGTMAARAVIRDVGRAMDIPYGDVDSIAKMIPFQIGMNIEKALEFNPELRKRYDGEQQVKELIDMARLLEGMPRHASTHAAGVVISKNPITEYVPLQKNDESITTQFPMGVLEELGLLKMDFLGLRTLTVIRDTVDMVRQNYSVEIDIDTMDMDDEEVFRIIGEGNTAGIFQLESPGMTQFMKELKPESLEDIIAGISLYRPGPMDQIPRYIKYKNNPESIRYDHPMLENILNVTYGCMVYQEQVMQIVREIGGYSMGRSDLVRRAMSKKKVSVMEEERKNFIHGITDEDGNIILRGAIRNGVDERTANKIFDEMMDFASYAFNKSHAAAYAVIAYQTAWLKRYYPVEFMAALINSYMGSSNKVSHYESECKALNIKVLPPDINESSVGFTVANGKIRFGLAAVKNVGESVVREIIKEREKNGEFQSFRDFCERVDDRVINKRCVESMIKCGAFDSFGIFRSRLMASCEKIIDGICQSRKKNLEGQLTIFEFEKDVDEEEICMEVYPDIKEFDSKMLLAMEKEMLGVYVSGHPLREYESEIRSRVTLLSSDLDVGYIENTVDGQLGSPKSLNDGARVVVAGIITEKKTKTTKSNNLMAFIMLEDLYGSMEVIVFPAVLSRFSAQINEEDAVIITGRISLKEDEQPKIICEGIEPLGRKKTAEIRLVFRENKDINFIKSLNSTLKYFNGNTPLQIDNQSGEKLHLEGEYYMVNPCESLLDELKSRMGDDNVKLA